MVAILLHMLYLLNSQCGYCFQDFKGHCLPPKGSQSILSSIAVYRHLKEALEGRKRADINLTLLGQASGRGGEQTMTLQQSTVV
jgi:hypothetical protein